MLEHIRFARSGRYEATNQFAHHDAIARAMLAIRGWKMHRIGTALGQQGTLNEIGAETSWTENHRTLQVHGRP